MTDLEDLNRRIVECTRCPRLVEYRERVARERRRMYRDWEYWGRPVPGFGDPHARALVIGLAPAAHGGNRTGRVFTGDRSGDMLYGALHRAGFASSPISRHVDDGMRLNDVYVTAAVRCAPPDNKPTPDEFVACRPYLHAELDWFRDLRAVVALGAIAFDAYLLACRERGVEVPRPKPRFAHAGRCHACSRRDPALLVPSQPTQHADRPSDPGDVRWRVRRPAPGIGDVVKGDRCVKNVATHIDMSEWGGLQSRPSC